MSKQQKEPTPYFDKNGRRVHVGDFIEFRLLVTDSDGLQHEFSNYHYNYYYGWIVKRKGKLCFRYPHFNADKKGNFIERRLSSLNFDSNCDWKIINETMLNIRGGFQSRS